MSAEEKAEIEDYARERGISYNEAAIEMIKAQFRALGRDIGDRVADDLDIKLSTLVAKKQVRKARDLASTTTCQNEYDAAMAFLKREFTPPKCDHDAE